MPSHMILNVTMNPLLFIPTEAPHSHLRRDFIKNVCVFKDLSSVSFEEPCFHSIDKNHQESRILIEHQGERPQVQSWPDGKLASQRKLKSYDVPEFLGRTTAYHKRSHPLLRKLQRNIIGNPSEIRT